MIFSFIDTILIFLTASTISYEIILFTQIAAWIWYPLCAVILIGAYILMKKYAPKEYIPISNRNSILLIGIAILCMCINIFTFRPDNDDVSFSHRAVVVTENISLPLSIYTNTINLPNFPAISPVHLTTSIETISALISHALNIPTMFFTHYILGSVSLFLFPIIIFAFFSILGLSQKEALIATVFTVIIYGATGDTHGDWGNFTLVRSWQGKTIYIMLFVPLTVILTLRAFIDKDSSQTIPINAFTRLYYITICSIGLTSTGYFIYPFIVFSIFFMWVIFNKGKVKIFRYLFTLSTTLIFSLILIFLIKIELLPPITNTDVWKFDIFTCLGTERYLPITNIDIWKLKIIRSLDEWHILYLTVMNNSITTVYYLLALIGCFFLFEQNKITKLFLYSSLLMFIFIVTPPISSIIIKIILPGSYWRLMFATNMLIIIGLFITYCLFRKPQPYPILTKLSKNRLHNTKFFPYIGLIFLVSYLFIKTPAVNSNILSMPLPYKFHKNTYPVTELCIKTLPKKAVVISDEYIFVHLALRRPDLRFVLTRNIEMKHGFSNNYTIDSDEENLLLDAYNDILYQCGTNGALRKLLKKSDANFFILSTECTEKNIKEDIEIDFDEWEYEFMDDNYKLLINKRIKNNHSS